MPYGIVFVKWEVQFIVILCPKVLANPKGEKEQRPVLVNVLANSLLEIADFDPAESF